MDVLIVCAFLAAFLLLALSAIGRITEYFVVLKPAIEASSQVRKGTKWRSDGGHVWVISAATSYPCPMVVAHLEGKPECGMIIGLPNLIAEGWEPIP